VKRRFTLLGQCMYISETSIYIARSVYVY